MNPLVLRNNFKTSVTAEKLNVDAAFTVIEAEQIKQDKRSMEKRTNYASTLKRTGSRRQAARVVNMVRQPGLAAKAEDLTGFEMQIRIREMVLEGKPLRDIQRAIHYERLTGTRKEEVNDLLDALRPGCLPSAEPTLGRCLSSAECTGGACLQPERSVYEFHLRQAEIFIKIYLLSYLSNCIILLYYWKILR